MLCTLKETGKGCHLGVVISLRKAPKKIGQQQPETELGGSCPD